MVEATGSSETSECTHTTCVRSSNIISFKVLLSSSLQIIQHGDIQSNTQHIFCISQLHVSATSTYPSWAEIAQSVQRLATSWDVRGSNPLWGARFSAPVQTGPCGHPASCTVGNGIFQGVKRPAIGIEHPTPSSIEVKERINVHLYYLSRPSWSVLG